MDLVTRRRAVYTGLRPYFDDNGLLLAIKLWQEKYADKPKYAFSEFLSECCKSKELRAQRTHILSSILHAIELPEKEMLADPFEELKPTQKIEQAPATASVGLTEIFEALLNAFLSKVSNKEQLTVRLYMINHIAELKIDNRSKLKFSTWVEQKTDTQPLSYEIAHMQKIINFMYVAICEHIGPVRADQHLSQSIKEVEVLAKAEDVNLYDFL